MRLAVLLSPVPSEQRAPWITAIVQRVLLLRHLAMVLLRMSAFRLGRDLPIVYAPVMSASCRAIQQVHFEGHFISVEYDEPDLEVASKYSKEWIEQLYCSPHFPN